MTGTQNDPCQSGKARLTHDLDVVKLHSAKAKPKESQFGDPQGVCSAPDQYTCSEKLTPSLHDSNVSKTHKSRVRKMNLPGNGWNVHSSRRVFSFFIGSNLESLTE